jgi:hypothetical protein
VSVRESPSLYRERERRVDAGGHASHLSFSSSSKHRRVNKHRAWQLWACTPVLSATAVRILQRFLEAGDWPLCSTRLHARGRAGCPCPTQSTIAVLPIYLHLYSISINLHISFFAAIRIISVVPPPLCKPGHKLEHALAPTRHRLACPISLSRDSPACLDTPLTPFSLFPGT